MMKTLQLFFVSLICLIVVSCINQTPSEEEDCNVTGLSLEINEMGAFYDIPDTRTTVTRIQNGYEFVWSETDSVGIFPRTGGQVAFAVNGNNSRYCDFDGGGWGLKSSSTYSAYYPLIGDFYLDKTNIPVDISGQIQNKNGDTSHLPSNDYLCSINSKVGFDGKVKLQFTHLINILHFKIRVPSPGNYTSVELKSDKPFSVKGTLNLSNGTVTSTKSVDRFVIGLKNVSFKESGGVIEVFMAMFPVNLTDSKLTVSAIKDDGTAYSFVIDGINYEAGIFYNYSERQAVYDVSIQAQTDYLPHLDTLRVLENPHKGWYHHYYSNSLDKYGLTAEEDNLIQTFPGMDHIYIRLAWSYFEPSEGQYDWHLIDDIINKYSKMGYGVAFRITCRETGSVGQFKNGCYYATPYWVKQAGVPGVEIQDAGQYSSWSPDYSNPIFLAKLENFHKAFAARYDGNPLVRYIDIGSMGDWGEGHTSYSTNEMIPDDVVKKHFDIYKRCYKKTPVVIMDNSIAYQRGDEPYVEGNPKSESIVALMNYAYNLGFGVRYDSFLVDWHLKRDHGGVFHWSVNRPYVFERFYKDYLVVHEEDHYAAIKKAGNWKGQNGMTPLDLVGSKTGAVYHTSGYEIFIHSMEITHPTYIGYHGKLKEWLSENPDLAKYAANKCGYWITPVSSVIDNENLRVTWRNYGVAPCYHQYQLRLHFIDDRGNDTVQIIEDSGNRSWQPGEDSTCEYIIQYPDSALGNDFKLYMQLYDTETDAPIDIALDKTYLGSKSMIPLL